MNSPVLQGVGTLRWPTLCAIAALLWVLLARVLGPNDLWDHTQPKTIAYTTDIIVHGGSHWILPIERGELPATKPPLYNWIAVPFVKSLGFNRPIGHKFPSLIALCLCWMLVVRIGRKIDINGVEAVGWIAAMILLANSTIFKLGYLARPDMLLTLWLTLGWAAATKVFVAEAQSLRGEAPRDRSSQHWLAAGFWACFTLAALTKGPPALILLPYAVIAARVIGGSWRSVRLLYPATGFIISAAIVGAWLYGVWRINPEHLQQVMWRNEILGRVTGTGPRGNPDSGWLKTLPYQLLYYLIRFIPWSILSLVGIVGLWSRQRVDGVQMRGWKAIQSTAGGWLCGAAIQVVLVVGVFTFSAGKRADYIAAAFPPGALLAAWWLLRMRPFLGMKMPWLAPAAAAIALTAITIVNQIDADAPAPHFGKEQQQFFDQVANRLSVSRLPVEFCFTGETHVQAMLGFSEKDGPEGVMGLVKRGRPFFVIAGQHSPKQNFAQWLRTKVGDEIVVRQILRSKPLLWRGSAPEELALYRVQKRRPTTTKPATQPAQTAP